MRQIEKVAIGLAFALSAIAIVFLLLTGTLGCEANPWNGWTCPNWMAYFLPFAALGWVVFPISVIVAGIFGVFWVLQRVVQKNDKTGTDR
ncbi:MAG: hypothetical protein ACU0BK_09115 [Shimia sp.]|uniref:hypothetical protein n=1 Tax=Shimia sp. TaxID=1954381 RepID=UPI004058927F